MLNRSLIIVRGKAPFLEWILSLPDSTEHDLTLEDVNDDPTAYLIPLLEDYAELDDVLEVAHGSIFDDQLASWWTDENDWPEDRSLERFGAWFDVTVHSMIEDLVDGPLEEEA